MKKLFLFLMIISSSSLWALEVECIFTKGENIRVRKTIKFDEKTTAKVLTPNYSFTEYTDMQIHRKNPNIMIPQGQIFIRIAPTEDTLNVTLGRNKLDFFPYQIQDFLVSEIVSVKNPSQINFTFAAEELTIACVKLGKFECPYCEKSETI